MITIVVLKMEQAPRLYNIWKYQEFQHFSGSDKPRMLFFMFMLKCQQLLGRKEVFHAQLTWAWKNFYNLGARLVLQSKNAMEQQTV